MKSAMQAVLAAAALWTTVADAAPVQKQVQAPEFAGISTWLNSEPLSMQQLRGKVVLVDFWTFDCINCINTLPFVKSWHDKYKDQGLVVVGVHTPEYAHERSTDNVKAAMKRFDIRYAVAQDNRYATWTAYSNRYWPAAYLINKKGQIVYTHFGEGKYQEIESTIRTLLAEPA
ncbi:thioredoxin family protein [Noviherbaspirillum aerium]|uniref:thioredoxin family protein n=1 Tax=Noviherbaspirillum aerium TaxID=2588497 RepID=UPI00124D2383|nr:thioredoxin family protein [Noviherbaspirillum aerium]